MTLSDRLEWLLVGCAIGFVLGYFTRDLREYRGEKKLTQEEREEIWSNKGEDGFMRFPVVHDVAILVALGLTLWASFAAAHLNNELKQVTSCNATFLKANLTTENTRTDYLKEQIDANTQLQKAQSSFLRTVYSNTSTDEELVKAGHDYLNKLDDFVEISDSAKQLDPYPTVDQLQACYDQ